MLKNFHINYLNYSLLFNLEKILYFLLKSKIYYLNKYSFKNK